MYGSQEPPALHADLFGICDGWSNEDLTHIQRIHGALSSLRIPFDCGGGITDEGDPWFSFCEADGEVIMHLALIDDVYHLFAPTMTAPLSGASLTEVTRLILKRLERRRAH